MKLNLKKDRVTLRKYIEKRIRDYPVYENLGPGDDEAAIALLTVGYYAAQGGYVNLVFDTREQAEVDGEWTVHIDNETSTCPFPKWNAACEAIYEGNAVVVTKHDGTEVKFPDADDEETIQAVFGDMIVDLITELRDDGTLSKLPLAPNAFMVVEEFDGQFLFPTYETRKTAGRILQ
ncbi:hypothetical protein LOC67_08265 [Stieleria sp. JC731]|uniref:hypothetical protein n=1 Tax=Pirellulaceae TaxID=2691357 RepID=UPI001E31E806|nr:hypothetical protein [Stieleria sp. JC731]MCC9600552.1 hypothetical protein [Stieleria sp. JC731]